MNYFIKLWLIFLFLFLIACGGSEAERSETESPPTAVSEAVPTDVPTVEVVEETAVDSTAVEPTAIVEPTATTSVEADQPTSEPVEETVAVLPRDFNVVGTAEATVDGELMTWYMLAGELDGTPQASSTWQKTSDGQYLLM
ncbi:MAG: hypothetical protein AAF490_31825, partial [Chloroflexota bacterium]